MRLISGFVDSYLDLNKEERVTFEAELNALPTKETEKVMQIVTSWMKEWAQARTREGRTEGRREGIEEAS